MMKRICVLPLIAILISSCSNNPKDSTITINESSSAIIMVEDELQQANIIESIRGHAYQSEIKHELDKTQNIPQNIQRIKELTYVLSKVEEITKLTGEFMLVLDKLKLDFVKKSDKKSIVIQEGSLLYPSRLDLGKVSDPNNVAPFKSREILKIDLLKFRMELMSLIGSYEWESKNYIFKLKESSKTEDYQDINQVIHPDSRINKDDGPTLERVFGIIQTSLSKLEKFERGNRVSSISFITAIQHDLISAKTEGIANWKGKVVLNH